MDTPQHLRNRRPLAGLSPHERRNVYCGGGMHSPNPEARTGVDAFDIRNDVNVEDACTTAIELIRAAIAQLDVLAVTPDLPRSYRGVVDGISALTRLASGCIGLMQAALYDVPPTEQPSLDGLCPRPR